MSNPFDFSEPPPEPRRSERPRREEDHEYEERPRRRPKEDDNDDEPPRSERPRRAEDRDYEERPRRRPREDDYDEPPRRRSRDDRDYDDDRRPRDDRPRRRSRDDDYDDDPPRRRPRDDRDYDDRPRRRSRDDDYRDDPPPRPRPERIEPKIPRAVPGAISMAGTGWIIFGVLNLLGGGLVVILSIVAAARAEEVAAKARVLEKAKDPRGNQVVRVQVATKDQIQTAAIQQGAGGAVSACVGVLFFLFGMGVVRSKARDVIGQAITSLILAGIFFLAFFLFVGALRTDIGQPLPEAVRTTIWITTVSALFHCVLLGASGTAALIGRKDYLLWMSRDRRKAAGLSNENPNAMTGDDFSSTFG